MWYNDIKQFYLQGLYTDSDLDIFVQAGMLTEEEKQQIIASKN